VHGIKVVPWEKHRQDGDPDISCQTTAAVPHRQEEPQTLFKRQSHEMDTFNTLFKVDDLSVANVDISLSAFKVLLGRITEGDIGNQCGPLKRVSENIARINR
jgi:hypothetical protein